MSSAICVSLDQSKILSCCNGSRYPKDRNQPSPIVQLVSVQDLRTGGRWYDSPAPSIFFPRIADRWFDPQLGQYSFRGLLIVIATGFISLPPLSIVSTMLMWESSQWLGENIVRITWLNILQESMDRCTGRCDITETLLKRGLNTIQSTNNQEYIYLQRNSLVRSIKD